MNYMISEIMDNNTGRRSEKWGYRVGRRCTIVPPLKNGHPLIVQYPDKGYFMTSTIISFVTDENSVWVKTKNSTYRFDVAKEDEECI
jgi:hypothetical protein